MMFERMFLQQYFTAAIALYNRYTKVRGSSIIFNMSRMCKKINSFVQIKMPTSWNVIISKSSFNKYTVMTHDFAQIHSYIRIQPGMQ